MVILMVSRGVPSENSKMNGLFEMDQARALAREGHTLILAALDLRSIRRRRPLGYSSAEQYGVKIRGVDLPLGGLPKGLFYRLGAWGLRRLYRRIVAEFGVPQVIHAHYTDHAYITALALGGEGVPLVVTEHSSLMNRDHIEEPLRRAAQKAYSSAAQVVAVSQALGRHIQQNLGVTPCIIPNIVDTETFSYAPPRPKVGFDFVTVGNLTEIKRHDLTIRAFAAVFGGRRDARLSLYGGGPQERELRDLAAELGVEEQVIFEGVCTRQHIAAGLRQADAFVLASHSETFGVAFIEAMSCGVPVIATRCGGPEDFVGPENGMLVLPDDQTALENAMRRIYEQAAGYDRVAISQATRDQFSAQAVAGQLERVYAAVVAGVPASQPDSRRQTAEI